MAASGSLALRRRLVKELAGSKHLRSLPVRQAFEAVPRELFVPEIAARQGLEAVYRDEAILTKRDEHGAPMSSSSQPAIMAAMLERLDLEPGQRVLEIGAGTGYNAALLAELVGPEGNVVSVDIDPEVAERARAALAESGHEVRVFTGDGRAGFAEAAPYDRIVVTAASPTVERAWRDQLADGGLLELPLALNQVPLAQAIPILRKTGDGLESVEVICGGFMPLRESAAPPPMPPTITAAMMLDGSAEQFVYLQSAAIGRLSEAGRRGLLALVLGSARRRPLGVRAAPWALHLFLALAGPDERLVTFVPRPEPGCIPTVGVVTRDGRGMALLGPGPKQVTRIDGYGDPAAERELKALVEEWVARGRPSEEQLRVRVGFGRSPGGRPWRLVRCGECAIAFDWEPPS